MFPLTPSRITLVKYQGIVTSCMDGSAVGWACLDDKLSAIQLSILEQGVFLLVFVSWLSLSAFSVVSQITRVLSVPVWNQQHPLQFWAGTELLWH